MPVRIDDPSVRPRDEAAPLPPAKLGTLEGPGKYADPPFSHPPFWRTRTRWMIAALVVLIMIHVGLLLVPDHVWRSAGLSPAFRFVGWLIYGPLFVWWMRAMNRGDGRTRGRVTAGELPCWKCGYDVSKLAEQAGKCPECAATYDRALLRERWELVFGKTLQDSEKS